jgi:cell division protein ZapA
MDDTFTINLYIVDKYYPIRIKRSDEELVRAAARLINDKVTLYRNRFQLEASGLDVMDLLAMAACHIAIDALKQAQNSDEAAYEKSISQLNQELKDFLS